MKSASGEYTFQYLSNNYPVFFTGSVGYGGTGYYHTNYMVYSLSYHAGEWRVRRKETHESNWNDAKLVFRLKTDCEFILLVIISRRNIEFSNYLTKSFLGSNVSKISGRWEEHGPDLDLDQEWPKTASVEITVKPSK